MPSDTDPLPSAPAPLPGIYVLNADPSFLTLMGDLLPQKGVHVTLEQLQPHVDATLAHLRAAAPDLVLLDAPPTRPEPAQCLAGMAADAELRRLPVVLTSTTPVLTTRLSDQYPALVRATLPKPFDLDVLYQTLGRLLAIEPR
jgi:CheY-like chemotaxis protein